MHSAFATSVRQTFFPYWTSDSHFILAINLVAKQQQFLGNCVGTLWLREGSKEALVSILNHFGCPVPPLSLVDLLNLAEEQNGALSGSNPASPAVPWRGHDEPDQALCSRGFHCT